MPVIRQLFGILIQMFWWERTSPNFHALYDEYDAVVDIRALEIITASLSSVVTTAEAAVA